MNMNDLVSMTYGTKLEKKGTTPDSRILVFMTGFFLGLVFFYFAGKQLIEDTGLLSMDYIEPLKDFSINNKGYLLYILGIRTKQFLFLIFCTLSIWAGCFLYAVLGWSGFQLGVIFFAAMYQYGMRGVFYCIFMIIPHGIFYFLVFVKLLNGKLENDKKYYHKKVDIIDNRARKVYESIKAYFVILLLLCLGILSECYINPWLMKWILLFF